MCEGGLQAFRHVCCFSQVVSSWGFILLRVTILIVYIFLSISRNWDKILKFSHCPFKMRVWGALPVSPLDKNTSKTHDSASHSNIIETPTVILYDSNQKSECFQSSSTAETCFSHFPQVRGRHTTWGQLLLSTLNSTVIPNASTKIQNMKWEVERETECSIF